MRKCLICEKAFEFKTAKKIYCGSYCRNKAQCNIEMKCLECGNEYKIPPYKKNMSHYCSKKCCVVGIGKKKARDILTRFNEKISEPDINGCINWKGTFDNKGYRVFFVSKKAKRVSEHAYRIAYKLFVGEIPEELSVCHFCDNRACVNVEHLWIGTHKQNMRDMIDKGRHNPRGKKNKNGLPSMSIY